MTTSLLRQVLTLALVLAAPLSGRAQDRVDLTIDEAVARGLAHAPRLGEARAREHAAAAATAMRAAQGQPALAIVSSVLRTNHVDEFGIPQADGSTRVIFPDIPNNYRVRSELTVPLYTSGRVDAFVAAARADQRAAAADRRAVTADLELDVVSAYWALATSWERVRVLERAQTRAEAVVADVAARVDSGLVPPNERLSAEAQRARQQVVLIQARHDALVAEAHLARLVGLTPGVSIVLATPVDRPAADIETLAMQPAEALFARATEARPERLALLERQSAARSSGAAASAALRPQIGALAAIEPARPNPRFVPRTDKWHVSWDLAVNATWSLWDGGRSRAERAAAGAQIDALASRLADLDASIAVELRQRQLEVASARAAIAASRMAVDAASEARRVVGERFDVGVATSTEVLDSDVALLDAELEQTGLMADLRVSEARLVRAAGGRAAKQ